jgi:Tol biopolymer transport system component
MEMRTSGKPRSMGWSVLAAGVVLVLPAVAQAAFPGANGRIAFTVQQWRAPPPPPPQPDPNYRSGYEEPTLVESRIETVLPSGRGRRVLHTFPAGEGSYYGEPSPAPAWSPSGRRLAFVEGGRLAIMLDDGTPLRQLPQLTESDREPACSPDGRRLAFIGTRPCLYCIFPYTVRSDGTGLRRVTELGAAWPTWSVKGTLAFVNYDDQYREPNPDDGLYTVRPDGSRQRRVFKRYWGTGEQPDWSPDGRSLAFGARGHIFTMRANGRRLRRLTDLDTATGYGNSDPTWSPDGRYIAFIRDHDLYVMRADGRVLRRIVDARAEDPDHPYAEFTQLSSPTWQALPR